MSKHLQKLVKSPKYTCFTVIVLAQSLQHVFLLCPVVVFLSLDCLDVICSILGILAVEMSPFNVTRWH